MGQASEKTTNHVTRIESTYEPMYGTKSAPMYEPRNEPMYERRHEPRCDRGDATTWKYDMSIGIASLS